MTKTRIWIISILSILLVSLASVFVVAYLLDQDTVVDSRLIGDIDVTLLLYYHKDGVDYPIEEVVIDQNDAVFKSGVFQLDVADPQAVEYVENLRIKLLVASDVDTYVRVRIVETLTLTTINYLGERTEIPIVSEPTLFNFESTWHYEEGLENYYYLKDKVKRLDASTPLEVAMITSYFPGANYNPRPLGYTVQFGVKVEAVQALMGPEMNWNLPNPPWGGAW